MKAPLRVPTRRRMEGIGEAPLLVFKNQLLARHVDHITLITCLPLSRMGIAEIDILPGFSDIDIEISPSRSRRVRQAYSRRRTENPWTPVRVGASARVRLTHPTR